MSCINIVIVLSSLSNERLPCHLLLFVISSPVSPLLFFCYSPVLSLSLVLYPSPFSIACHLPLPFLYRLSFTPPLYPSTDPFFYPLLHPTSTLNPITYSLTPPPPPHPSLHFIVLSESSRKHKDSPGWDARRCPPLPTIAGSQDTSQCDLHVYEAAHTVCTTNSQKPPARTAPSI